MAKAAATEHDEPNFSENEAYEQEAVAAWRNIPFKPSPPNAEIELASVIRERLRLRGFDLKLGPDGSVLIVDTKGKHRSPPPDLAEKVWEYVEAIGALLDHAKARPAAEKEQEQ